MVGNFECSNINFDACRIFFLQKFFFFFFFYQSSWSSYIFTILRISDILNYILFFYYCITYYHKLSGFIQQSFINLQFRKSEVQHRVSVFSGYHKAKIKVLMELSYSLGTLRKNSASTLIQLVSII